MQENGGTLQEYYTYSDYLGSVAVVTNDLGMVLHRHSFDAWGRKRNAEDWSSYKVEDYNAPWLFRGYTGHEMLPEFDLINMNGRLYDNTIGRMLSADNYAGYDGTSQSYNRYSYAFNNPLKYTDPSGEFNGWAAIGGAVGGALAGAAYTIATGDGDNLWRNVAFGAGAGALAGGFIGNISFASGNGPEKILGRSDGGGVLSERNLSSTVQKTLNKIETIAGIEKLIKAYVKVSADDIINQFDNPNAQGDLDSDYPYGNITSVVFPEGDHMFEDLMVCICGMEVVLDKVVIKKTASNVVLGVDEFITLGGSLYGIKGPGLELMGEFSRQETFINGRIMKSGTRGGQVRRGHIITGNNQAYEEAVTYGITNRVMNWANKNVPKKYLERAINYFNYAITSKF